VSRKVSPFLPTKWWTPVSTKSGERVTSPQAFTASGWRSARGTSLSGNSRPSSSTAVRPSMLSRSAAKSFATSSAVGISLRSFFHASASARPKPSTFLRAWKRRSNHEV